MAENLDLIVVLGGGLKKDAQGWRTTNFYEGDNFGVQGGRLRVDAAYQLYQNLSVENSNLLILSSGGRGQLRSIADSPAVASIIKKELLALGIPEEKILLEENSNNTYQQLQEISKIISEKKFHSINVVSNQYHLPRVQAMMEFGPGLDLLKAMLASGGLILSAAEKVLTEFAPEEWRDLINEAYQSAAMKERLQKEERGVDQIKSGLYKWQ